MFEGEMMDGWMDGRTLGIFVFPLRVLESILKGYLALCLRMKPYFVTDEMKAVE